MLILLKNSSSAVVMISSMSVSICSWFHAKGANSGKIIGNIITFRRCPSLMPACGGLLEPKRSKLRLLKSTLNADHVF